MEAKEIPALKEMEHSFEVITSTTNAVNRHVKADAYSEPHAQFSSPAGFVIDTPNNVLLASATTTSLSAGQDIGLASQGNASTAVNGGVSLFTYGKAGRKAKANQEVGLKLHAATGKLSSQSQSGMASLVGDKTVTVASIAKSVTISAPKKHLLLTAQGACIKLEGGNIEVHAPGKVDFKATKKELTAPVSVSGANMAMKISELSIKRDLEIEYVDADGNVLADEPIALKFSDGSEKKTVLDKNGRAIFKKIPLGPFGAKQPRRKEEHNE